MIESESPQKNFEIVVLYIKSAEVKAADIVVMPTPSVFFTLGAGTNIA
jgi:hypothetical protein